MLVNRGQGPRRRVISEKSVDLMMRQSAWTGRSYYGYGLGTYIIDGRLYVCHGGGNAGFRSAIAMDMEAGFGTVFLLNSWGETDTVVAAAQDVRSARYPASECECGSRFSGSSFPQFMEVRWGERPERHWTG